MKFSVSYGQQPYSIAERLRASGTTIIAVVVQGSDPYDDADHQVCAAKMLSN